ncbi:SMI1/KNR4 family protein [Lentzea sp. NPDC051213]|uniref:SMI1/KNR4 family protein n=1 Tax=Lentzea sp. NPDC051213 TaxID=3364126 RepID=UPI0037A93BC2
MDFWSDSPNGVHPPLTNETVRDAETLLGVRLPESLLELLRVQNGGGVVPSRSAFPTTAPTSWAADHVPFEDLMGIGPAGRALTILGTPYLVKEWGLPSPVVLLTGDGHWWIALDYRTCGPNGEPAVVWLDADSETELALAPDFRSFLAGLVPTDRFE